jgi:hypothetical protein
MAVGLLCRLRAELGSISSELPGGQGCSTRPGPGDLAGRAESPDTKPKTRPGFGQILPGLVVQLQDHLPGPPGNFMAKIPQPSGTNDLQWRLSCGRVSNSASIKGLSMQAGGMNPGPSEAGPSAAPAKSSGIRGKLLHFCVLLSLCLLQRMALQLHASNNFVRLLASIAAFLVLNTSDSSSVKVRGDKPAQPIALCV